MAKVFDLGPPDGLLPKQKTGPRRAWCYLNVKFCAGGDIVWQPGVFPPPSRDDEDEAFVVHLHGLPKINGPSGFRPKAVARIRQLLEAGGINEITLDDSAFWTIDLTQLAKRWPNGSPFDWLDGEVRLLADWLQVDPPLSGLYARFVLTEERVRHNQMDPIDARVLEVPLAIRESLQSFQKDHPDPMKAAFIMMQFGETIAHTNIETAIRGVLKEHSIDGLRADDKQYHRDVFQNVETYMHGCGFGIAIFERIENNNFNSNVGLEVGYMTAMGKHVCYLKDQTLPTLQTDLIGALYRPFDVLNPAATIPKQLEGWLRDWGFIGERSGSHGHQRAGLVQKLEVTVERAQPLPDLTGGNFLEYLNGLNALELYTLANVVLVQQAQTFNGAPYDSTLATLLDKQFLKKVPVRQSLRAMQSKAAVPYTILPAVWRHLNDNRRWLLDRAKQMNSGHPERRAALDHITFDDSYV